MLFGVWCVMLTKPGVGDLSRSWDFLFLFGLLERIGGLWVGTVVAL